MELADIVVINKADGEGEEAAKRAVQTFRSALMMLHAHDAVWQPKVHCASALSGMGIDTTWQVIEAHRAALSAEGLIDAQRANQRVRWMWDSVEDLLAQRLRAQGRSDDLEAKVRAGTLPPTAAARQMLDD